TTGVTGILPATNGGTGINNSTRTLTVNTNAGTIDFTGASKTLTVPLDASVSGTNTGDQTTVSGNAGTATTLQNTRTIWGQNFNGSANVTGAITLGANDLTMTGSLAATGARVTKGWFTDVESTNMPTVGGTSLSSTFQASDADLTTIAGLTATTDNFMIAASSAWASRTPTQARTSLGLVIGTDVQAYDADLTTWAGITPGTNVGTFLATPSSANLRGALTDENGTGAALFSGATTPDFTTGFTIGAAAASGKFIVGNGTNYIPSTSTIPTSAGSTGKILVSDGTNYVLSTPTFPNASATANKVIKSDGTNWTASTETFAAPGTSGNIPISDGTNWTSAARYPIQVATADIAATASATSTTTLFTPTADGMYRVSIYMKITTTGTSPVAGPVTITYTDADGSVAQSHTMLLQNTSGAVVTTTVNNSTTTGTVNGSMVMNAKSGVAIQYAIAVSGTFAAGRYTAHLICERLK
ncbi:MAG TPA: hypothetical protein VMY77_03190, partial [Chitinophagaceae bacterium]|nr:hypothetical protein [Chitinophagaceae bacterium]